MSEFTPEHGNEQPVTLLKLVDQVLALYKNDYERLEQNQPIIETLNKVREMVQTSQTTVPASLDYAVKQMLGEGGDPSELLRNIQNLIEPTDKF